MKIFLALIGTPLLALMNLSAVYALATPSCRNQTQLWLHGVTGTSFVLCLVATTIALTPPIRRRIIQRRRNG